MKCPLSLLAWLLAFQGLAQSQTATVTAYCRSLCLNSVTATYGAVYNFEFTTPDGKPGQPLYVPGAGGTAPLFSNEVQPLPGQPGKYQSDFELLSGNNPSSYGTLLLNFPTADTNRDSIPDVLDPALPMYTLITGTGNSSWPSSNYFTLNLRFSRTTNSPTGSFSGNWYMGGGNYYMVGSLRLMLLQGCATYTRGPTNQLQFQLTRSNPDGLTTTTLTGAVAYAASANQISLPRFHLTDTQGRTYTALHTVLTRHGQRYSGNLSFVDGAPETPWADYVNWILTLTDKTDTNTNGIPDISDPNALQIPRALLTLTTNGPGTVSPALGGQNLELNETYRLTATPAIGYLFDGWSGDLTSSSRTLTFTLLTNLCLQANFSPNPFYPVRGTYYGLIEDTNHVANQTLGSFTATTTPGGTYSARFQLGGQTFTLSGGFDATGSTYPVIVPPDLRPLFVQLHLDLTNNTGLSGSIGDGTWCATITANKASFSPASNPCAFAGKYTFAIPSSAEFGSLPVGHSYGTVTVDKAGHIRCSGWLADGARVSQSTMLSSTGDWPLYVSLYARRGCLAGWLTFTNPCPLPMAGLPVWLKPAATTRYAPEGFTNRVIWLLSPYAAPAAGTPPFGWTNGLICLRGGDLAEPLADKFSLGPRNKLTTTATNKLSLRLLANGLFQGRVTPPDASRPVSFQGAFLQRMRYGFGYLLGATESGTVDLSAQPFRVPIPPNTNLVGILQRPGLPATINYPPPIPSRPTNIFVVPTNLSGIVVQTNQFIVPTNIVLVPIQVTLGSSFTNPIYSPPTISSSGGAVIQTVTRPILRSPLRQPPLYPQTTP